MKCKEIEMHVTLFSELTENEKEKVLAHLKICKPCSELFNSVHKTNNIIHMAAKAKVELDVPLRLTNTVMNRIDSRRQQQRITDMFAFKFNLGYIKYAMATSSLFLIVIFGVEQFSLPIAKKIVSMNSSKKIILDRKTFQENFKNSDAINYLSLANNCKSPFNITKVNSECLKNRKITQKVL